MTIALGAAFCLVSGYVVVSFAWPRAATRNIQWIIKIPLVIGFGLGIFSVVFFLERLLSANYIFATDACVTAGMFLAYVLVRARSRGTHAISSVTDFKFPKWIGGAVKASFAISMLSALYAAISRTLVHRHGEGWDAFAIWNLHARFLLLGGAHWRDGFSPLIPWSHPDYPLLVPAAVAHLWMYLDSDSAAVPAAIALLFTAATVALLVFSLAILRGANAAMLAAVALVSTPFFIEQGTSQYVDVPLSFFYLATIALAHLHERLLPETHRARSFGFLVLAGLSAGFAAWTKNEGLLFLFAFIAAQLTLAITKPASTETWFSAWFRLATLALSTAPALVLIFWFKHSVAPPGDIFRNPGDIAHKLVTPARYWIVLQWYVKEFFRFGNWWIVPATVLLAAFYWIFPRSHTDGQTRALRVSLLTLALTLAGYFAIYVITPRDLYWHLRFSLNRLFLQLWPAIIFLLFLFAGRRSAAISQNEPKSSENRP